MIKCKVIEKFTLNEFEKLQNIKRASIEEKGKLFVNDEFECEEDMAKYLLGENSLKRAFVKVIEVIPEAKIEHHEEQLEPKAVLKTEKKKTTKKKK